MTDRWTQARQRGAKQMNREQWRDYLTDIDPERRLMAAVIRRAVKDMGLSLIHLRRCRRHTMCRSS